MNFRLVIPRAVLVSILFGYPSFARPPESPWDCIRRVLQQLTPERPPLHEVVSQLEDLLRTRADVVGVAESLDLGFIAVTVKTADEHRYIDGRFGALGYRGYAVSPDISLRDREEWSIWTQLNLLEYLPDGVDRMRRKQSISFEQLRAATAESKIDEGLRAQLASDDFRLDSRWNPERRILLSVYPHRMHWHYLHATAQADGAIPSAEDIRTELAPLVAAFKRRYAHEVGMQVIAERPLRGDIAVRLMVTFPSQPGFIRVLRDENVSSATPLENYDLD